MIATYRVQLTPEFGFDALRRRLPYFARLGVSHLYLSPVMEARPGSRHGYDVIDHNAVRGEYGGREAFERLREEAVRRGLGLILDFVPNHAYVGPHNRYWQDVLAYGPHSPHADHFDIDWSPLKEELREKILLPFLGDTYGEVLDEGAIEVVYREGRFWAQYFENRFALCPATYDVLLADALEAFEETEAYWDLKDLVESFEALDRTEREKAETLSSRLHQVVDELDVAPVLGRFRGSRLHELLERQFWRLSFWKTAGDEVNYRRFFDINGLVALRMEDEEVFWDAHRLLGELLAEEGVDGVRVDHVDGLFDPHRYLEDLDELGPERTWVEKILAPGETLPEAWPVAGTTGYEFLNDAMGVLVDPDGELALERTYRRFVPSSRAWSEVVYRSKMVVMTTSLSSERFRLSYELDRIAEADYHTRDFTLAGLREALSEVIAALDRYRTYLPSQDEEAAEEVIREAIYRARQRNPATEPTVFDFIADVLLGRVRADLADRQAAWTGRFQQYSGPVTAKGVEDTAFYRYVRLAALNEVGGDPGELGRTKDAFHARARFRSLHYPENLLPTATHDHKRGADTRMRGIVLAELPELWSETVNVLAEDAASYRGIHGPSPRDEYLCYQTLLSLWTDSDRSELADRIWRYMRKASREGKRRTSWINPDPDYEDDLQSFVGGLLANEDLEERIDPLARRIAGRGFFNTIAQTVLQHTTPGVPDLYQGTELLDLSLVDPDNRRPVDYELRQDLLEELADLIADPSPEPVRHLLVTACGIAESGNAESPDRTGERGGSDSTLRDRAKLYLVARLLRLRQAHPSLAEGSYQGLDLEGPGSDRYLAYLRRREAAAERETGTAKTGDDTRPSGEPRRNAMIGVVPRFPRDPDSEETAVVRLPDGAADRSWTEYLTGATIRPSGGGLDPTELPLPWGLLISRR